MKKILVTGGAGFLGSHLCRKLVAQGHDVLCVDNFYTGNKDNILDLLDKPNFELLRHDVTFPLYVEVDEIYNLACPASPVHYQKNPVQTLKTSVHGAINMLGLAKRTGAKILQASTSEVYGDPEEHPQNERYWGKVNPIGPRACYDEGKRAAETLFFDYHRQHNVKIKVIRIFNTYGPNMSESDGRVVSNFIMQALRNEDITVYGDGMQTRSFCYVDDLIDGIVAMMNSDDDIIGPINLGNPIEFTIKDLASKIIMMTGSSSKIKFETLPVDDPKQRKPDIGAAFRLLGWEPKIDLEQGLEKTINYFNKKVPRQHFYQDLEGWFGFQPQYEKIIDLLPHNAVWVEVGCWMGRSLAWLLVENHNKQKKFNIHAVDTWRGNPNESWYAKQISLNGEEWIDSLFDKFMINMNPFKDEFTCHRKLSWEGAGDFADASVDYVMIDAGHDEESVTKDILAWWPKVKPGGYMGGDDYVVDSWGVYPAVQKFIKDNNLEIEITPNQGSSKTFNWLVRKPQ